MNTNEMESREIAASSAAGQFCGRFVFVPNNFPCVSQLAIHKNIY